MRLHCRASYGSGKPVIGILAEYDALTGLSQVAGSETRKELVADGNGHGCGHNLLGAGSMAAAFAIKKYLEEKGEGSGKVVSSTAALVRKVLLQKHLWQETACSRSATRLSPGIREM